MGTIVRFRKTELYEEMVDQYEIFDHNYDFLFFLAVLGYHENTIKRNNFTGSPKDDTRGEIGLENVYANDAYRSIMACLAYHHTSDPEALIDSETQMETLAKYAAGGLEVAEAEFGDISGDPTDAIINYLRETQSQKDDVSGELQKIVESFDEEMLAEND